MDEHVSYYLNNNRTDDPYKILGWLIPLLITITILVVCIVAEIKLVVDAAYLSAALFSLSLFGIINMLILIVKYKS